MKLRLKGKGKRWMKGHSSSSNPSVQRHRKSAKSRFFQENLDSPFDDGKRLTATALKLLDNNSSSRASLVTDGNEGWEDVESTSGTKTFKTFDTFATDWSHCSNVSYSKLIGNFRSDSALHKEMLAVLACTTEIIDNQGGTGTNTEYFAALITTLENIDCDETLLAATVSLLGIGIKSVPREVLIATFPKSSKALMDILLKYADTEETMIIRGVMKCLQELLRAQDVGTWKDHSTVNMFESILAFTVHSKPKVRKVAHTAVCAVLKLTTYMMEQKLHESDHPAATIAANFCIRQIEKNSSLGSITTTLHVFSLLKDILYTFPKSQLKTACESILKGMTLRNPVIVTCGLCVLESMFLSRPHASTLTIQLNGQLIAALYDFQPPVTDIKPTLAWISTVESGFVNLVQWEVSLFMESMPRFFTTVSSLWLSGNDELVCKATTTMAELIENNIATVIKTQCNAEHKAIVSKLVVIIHEGLKYQYHLAWKPVLHLIGVVFKALGESCKDILFPYLQSLAEFRDSHQFSLTNELDHAIGAAVRSMGPQVVLQAIPLKMSGFCKDVNEEFKRSWLIPILKENIQVSSLQCFMDVIHPLIITCRNYAQKMEADNNQVGSLSYTLLETQLWALLPSFCLQPSDIAATFPKMAKGLGTLLNNRKDLRLTLMMCLRRLVTYSYDNNKTEDMKETSRFAKNYLPILFNIYTTPSKGSDEEGIRLASLETIKLRDPAEPNHVHEHSEKKVLHICAVSKPFSVADTDTSVANGDCLMYVQICEGLVEVRTNCNLYTVYLTLAPEDLRKELYDRINQKLDATSNDDHFIQESVLDLLRVLVPFQSVPNIVELFETKLSKLKETTDYKQQKKYFRILEELCSSETDNCNEFIECKIEEIKSLLLDSLSSSAPSSRGPRLKCLLNLMKRNESIVLEMISSVVPEAVLCCCDINSRCRATAFQLLETMCDAMKENLDVFVDIVMAGLTGPPQLVTATVMALTVISKHFKDLLDNEMVNSLVNRVCLLLCSTSREITKMAFNFLEMYVGYFDKKQIFSSLPEIIKAFSTMTDDCKNCLRRKTRDLLAKLERWFGSETILPLIPAADTLLIRRVRNLHKIHERKKRQRQQEREAKKSNKDPESEAAFAVKPKVNSIDELLEDVYMSDLEIDEKEKIGDRKKTKNKQTKNHVWLQEEDNDIVDFTNLSATKKISATNPLLSAKNKPVVEKTNKSDKNHGFKTSLDGRLIIKDDSGSESDSGFKIKKKLKLRPSFDSESDLDVDDSDMEEDRKGAASVQIGRKRRLSTGTDDTSGRAPSKYQAGGTGIHRPVNSKTSMADNRSVASVYKSKKGSGDVKRSGMPSPYAYMPLQRNKLNKRKKMKASTEFKSIVRGAKKGAKVGSKLKQKGNRR